MTTCSHAHCHRPAVMAIHVFSDPLSLRTVVYYDHQNAPPEADARCRVHGVSLMVALVKAFVPEPETHPDHLPH